MGTIVDTNVLVDFLDVSTPWNSWSSRQIEAARRAGPLVINQIILAELAAGFSDAAVLDEVFSPRRFLREELPWNAAFPAGQAFVKYRRAGGDKRSPMPDFYIGAHAAVHSHSVLTRDPVRYRSYFPDLDIIAPDTHP